MAHAITALPRVSRQSGVRWRVRNNLKFGKTLLAAVAVFWPLCLPAQSLPTIKAVVGQPVLQKLMGGCSDAMRFSLDDLRPRYRQISSDRLHAR
jgi:hypothetical protein